MDTNFNWNKHITALASKVSRNAGILYKLRDVLPRKALKNLYHCFIESHLLYCASAWGTAPLGRLQTLFSAQKKGVRALNRWSTLYYNKETGTTPSHTKPIFTEHSLLALPNIIAKSILSIMHKVKLGVSPTNISQLFTEFRFELSAGVGEDAPSRNTRYAVSSQANHYDEPVYQLTRSKLQLAYVGPRLYNLIVTQVNVLRATTRSGQSDLSISYFDPFKKAVTQHLLTMQGQLGSLDPNNRVGQDVEWNTKNFALLS